MKVPADRYKPSNRTMPKALPPVEYDSDDIARKVGTTKAYISFKNRLWKVPKAFRDERLAIRPRKPGGLYAVCFGATQIATIDLKTWERQNTMCQPCLRTGVPYLSGTNTRGEGVDFESARVSLALEGEG